MVSGRAAFPAGVLASSPRTSRTRQAPRCGTSTSARRSRELDRGSRASGFLPSHHVRSRRRRDRGGRDLSTGAAPGLRGARRAPGGPALRSAHGHHRPHAAVPCTGSRGRSRARGSGEGHGDRDGLHVRRSHRRHVVARARLAPSRRCREGRDHRPSHLRWTGMGVSRSRFRERRDGSTRRTHRQAGAWRSRGDAPEAGSLLGESPNRSDTP